MTINPIAPSMTTTLAGSPKMLERGSNIGTRNIVKPLAMRGRPRGPRGGSYAAAQPPDMRMRRAVPHGRDPARCR